MSRIKYSPLYLKAKTELVKMIKKGDFKNNKLPPEDKLSEMLGISRSTIREALITLDREGIITKKQGIGNLIHKSTLETKMRIDLIRDFLKLLEDGSYKASVKGISSGWVDNVPQLDIKTLSSFRDKKYFLVELLYLADSQPAILARNIIPESVLNRTPQREEMPFDSFEKYLNFLNKYTDEEISHSISKYAPGKANRTISKILKIKENEPIIKRDEFYYGIFDKLICYSEIFFNPHLIGLTMVHKLNQ